MILLLSIDFILRMIWVTDIVTMGCQSPFIFYWVSSIIKFWLPGCSTLTKWLEVENNLAFLQQILNRIERYVRTLYKVVDARVNVWWKFSHKWSITQIFAFDMQIVGNVWNTWTRYTHVLVWWIFSFRLILLHMHPDGLRKTKGVHTPYYWTA